MLETTTLCRWLRNFKWNLLKSYKNTIKKLTLYSMRMNKIVIKVVKILNKTLSNKLILKLKLQEKIKVTRNFKNLKRFKEKIYLKMKFP